MRLPWALTWELLFPARAGEIESEFACFATLAREPITGEAS